MINILHCSVTPFTVEIQQCGLICQGVERTWYDEYPACVSLCVDTNTGEFIITFKVFGKKKTVRTKGLCSRYSKPKKEKYTPYEMGAMMLKWQEIAAKQPDVARQLREEPDVYAALRRMI